MNESERWNVWRLDMNPGLDTETVWIRWLNMVTLLVEQVFGSLGSLGGTETSISSLDYWRAIVPVSQHRSFRTHAQLFEEELERWNNIPSMLRSGISWEFRKNVFFPSLDFALCAYIGMCDRFLLCVLSLNFKNICSSRNL